jgi:hypothetical protein
MDMGYKISIDPGINATGWCVWLNGKVDELLTIRTKGDRDIEKLNYLASTLIDLFEACCPIPIDAVVVEEFQGGFHPKRKSDGQKDENYGVYSALQGMKKCSSAQGVIIGVARGYVSIVDSISKKLTKKEETALLAKAYGLKGSKDALDAFQIGICAGFDKK